MQDSAKDDGTLSTDLMAKVRQIEIRSRQIVRNRTLGAWHASFKGMGIEFAEVREYQEGDDVRAIDWNVSARAGYPHVKLFTEEREQNVFLLADCTASLDFGSGPRSKREILAEIAAVLAFSATLNKDRVGLALHSDHEELHIAPARGHRHVLRIIRELLVHRPAATGTDLAGALDELLATTLKRSIVFILGDLLTSDFERPLRALTQRHEVIVLHLTDPMEREMPNLPRFANLAIEDLENSRTGHFPARRREAFADQRENARRDLTGICRRAAADFLHIDTANDYVPALIGLFDARTSRRT
ncbi:DUF58 domain-containing protein [Haloferula sp.]|uniref:DUF58 domain-containing protein n=1 Tax=Haloferula sp. TaxID=2497595 RepID=UPI003C775A41